jgi:hypothetical protein
MNLRLLNHRNWLESADELPQFRGGYIGSVDKWLPLANAPNGYNQDHMNGHGYEEPLKPKLVMNMEMYM